MTLRMRLTGAVDTAVMQLDVSLLQDVYDKESWPHHDVLQSVLHAARAAGILLNIVFRDEHRDHNASEERGQHLRWAQPF